MSSRVTGYLACFLYLTEDEQRSPVALVGVEQSAIAPAFRVQRSLDMLDGLPADSFRHCLLLKLDKY